MKKFISDIGIYAAVTAILLSIFILIQPLLTQNLPSDYSRHKLIIDALKNPDIQPDIIFLGDSRSMFGINAKVISAQLPGNPLIYNLSSVGQWLFEGCYFISSVSAKTKHVYHCMAYSTFNTKNIGIGNDKAISMILNGYKLDDATRSILLNTNPVFDQNSFVVAFEARTSLKSSLHSYLRFFLDEERFADNFHDLYFPHTFTSTRNKVYRHSPYKYNIDSLQVTNTSTSIVNRVFNYLKTKNIQYHIVLMPLNPDLIILDDSLSNSYINRLKIKIPGIEIINLSKALNANDFYDAIHPNKNGANKLSLLLSGFLK
jgi:hypothetical protein